MRITRIIHQSSQRQVADRRAWTAATTPGLSLPWKQCSRTLTKRATGCPIGEMASTRRQNLSSWHRDRVANLQPVVTGEGDRAMARAMHGREQSTPVRAEKRTRRSVVSSRVTDPLFAATWMSNSTSCDRPAEIKRLIKHNRHHLPH